MHVSGHCSHTGICTCGTVEKSSVQDWKLYTVISGGAVVDKEVNTSSTTIRILLLVLLLHRPNPDSAKSAFCFLVIASFSVHSSQTNGVLNVLAAS